MASSTSYTKASFEDGTSTRRDRRPAALPGPPAKPGPRWYRDQRIVRVGAKRRNAAVAYSAQPGNMIALREPGARSKLTSAPAVLLVIAPVVHK